MAGDGGTKAATTYQLTGGTKVQAAVIERFQPRRTTDIQTIGASLMLGMGFCFFFGNVRDKAYEKLGCFWFSLFFFRYSYLLYTQVMFMYIYVSHLLVFI